MKTKRDNFIKVELESDLKKKCNALAKWYGCTVSEVLRASIIDNTTKENIEYFKHIMQGII